MNNYVVLHELQAPHFSLLFILIAVIVKAGVTEAIVVAAAALVTAAAVVAQHQSKQKVCIDQSIKMQSKSQSHSLLPRVFSESLIILMKSQWCGHQKRLNLLFLELENQSQYENKKAQTYIILTSLDIHSCQNFVKLKYTQC